MKMKLKKKKKKRFYILFLCLIYFSSFFITVKLKLKENEHSLIVKYVLNNNTNYISKKEDKKIVTKVVSYIANVDISKPITFINNNYDITYKEKKINKPTKIITNDKKAPIVYLYNTHQKEEYSLSNNEAYNIKPTVMTLSYILREKLNENNIPTIVEENDISEVLNINNWNYAASYKVSRMLLENIKEKNPSLKYFIDLHRDSVNRKISSININNKSYARILFIIGLENPNYETNLVITEKLNSIINNKYPDLSRGIYKKKGKGVNGVYNQDFDSNTILIEVGGEENTIDEVYNTALVLTEILTNYIKDDLNEN